MNRICKSCGTMDNTKWAQRGSLLVSMTLWLFFVLGLFMFVVPGVIFFFIALIHSIWRLSSLHRVCNVCSSPELVPADSPVGRQIAAQSQIE